MSKAPFSAPAPDALKIVEDILPIVQDARARGWEINFAVEWCDGETFTVSGRLPRKTGG